jgi:hypothetical protein
MDRLNVMEIPFDARKLMLLAKLYRLCIFSVWTGVVGIALLWLTRGSQFPFIPQMIFFTFVILIMGLSLLAFVGLGDYLGQPSWAMIVTGLLLGIFGITYFLVLGLTVWVAIRLLKDGVRIGLFGVNRESLGTVVRDVGQLSTERENG